MAGDMISADELVADGYRRWRRRFTTCESRHPSVWYSLSFLFYVHLVPAHGTLSTSLPGNFPENENPLVANDTNSFRTHHATSDGTEVGRDGRKKGEGMGRSQGDETRRKGVRVATEESHGRGTSEKRQRRVRERGREGRGNFPDVSQATAKRTDVDRLPIGPVDTARNDHIAKIVPSWPSRVTRPSQNRGTPRLRRPQIPFPPEDSLAQRFGLSNCEFATPGGDAKSEVQSFAGVLWGMAVP